MTLEEEINHSVKLLQAGKIILYPTDTIWGIGCDATLNKPVQRIYKLKRRDDSKSMIILLNDISKLAKYVEHVPPIAYDLIENSRSPLTIVYQGARNISKKLIAPDGTIAIRVVRGRFTSPVIEKLGNPIVSTSANISGQPSAPTFSQISEEVKENVDYIVEHFRNQARAIKPSTIIKLEENGSFTIIRP